MKVGQGKTKRKANDTEQLNLRWNQSKQHFEVRFYIVLLGGFARQVFAGISPSIKASSDRRVFPMETVTELQILNMEMEPIKNIICFLP